MIFSLFFLWPIALPLVATYIGFIVWLADSRRYIYLTILLLFPFFAYQATWLYVFYSAIPSGIKLAYPVSFNNESDGYCGAAVFKLPEETLGLIKEQGLRFFAGATQPRGSMDLRLGYREWKETPTPTEWESPEGSWLNCSSLNTESYKEIITAAKKRGAYFARGSKGTLVVVPSLGYVVFSFIG